MSTGIVAEKYSTAIFELAQEQDLLKVLEEDFLYVLEVMSSHKELKLLLAHPVMENKMKIDLVKKIFADSINKIALNFINVMIERGRSSYITEAITNFITLSREARGITEATVIVTEPLTEQAQEKLMQRLQSILQKEVVLKIKIDKKILGGMIVQIGDKRIDASIARRLEEFEKVLRNVDSTEIGVDG